LRRVSRREDLLRIGELAGEGVVEVDDPQAGWPGLVRVRVDDGWVPVAMHVGPVGLSHRDRDEVERRFQNPGQNRPVSAPGGAVPVLIGLWDEGARPVLVGMEATRRLGRGTRQSLFIPLWLLERVEQKGWAEHSSTSGERIIGFDPALLPIYVELVRHKASVSAELLTSVVEASGLYEAPEETPDLSVPGQTIPTISCGATRWPPPGGKPGRLRDTPGPIGARI